MMPNRPSYPSDMTDEQWEVLCPLIPPAKHGGRPRQTDMRDVLDAIFYLLRTGCQWDALPRTYPPRSTVHDYYSAWRKDGTLESIHDTLRENVRRKAGRDPQPTAAIIDSQSSKTTEKGGSCAATTQARR